MEQQQQQQQQQQQLDLARQKAFFLRFATTVLPQAYTSADANMLSLAFFILAALDLLGLLDAADEQADGRSTAAGGPIKRISTAQKQAWIRWIYSFQAPSSLSSSHRGGFRGTRFWHLGHGLDDGADELLWDRGWDRASLANTFMALLMLLMLGDDLERVRKDDLARWVKSLQSSASTLTGGGGGGGGGGFAEDLPRGGTPQQQHGDNDMRMCYCAAGIACILGPAYECVDAARLRRFVVNAQGYEGGVGQRWAMEGHSGLNYCAIGCLALLDRLEAGAQIEGLHTRLHTYGFDIHECVRYMLMRQTSWVEDEENEEEDEEDDDDDDDDDDNAEYDGHTPHEYFGVPLDQAPATSYMAGFNGRTNKMADTCYCFWNLSALAILGAGGLADHAAVRRYLLEKTQHRMGGFAKAPGEYPDLMHSYLGLAALALMKQSTDTTGNGAKEDGLKDLDPVLCVSAGVWARLERLHATANTTSTTTTEQAKALS